MMLSRDEVIKIAKLARLTLSEEEIVFYQKQLTRVLNHMQELSQVDTTQEPFVQQHVPKEVESLRADVAEPFANHEGLMANAPAVENNCFLLPTIVEHN